MFQNYIKIAYRNLFRHKLFSIINISGLALGITVCTIISLWIQQELSYDGFHKNSDRIYRIERELFRDNLYSRWPITSGAYKQALIDDYPEIINAVRLWKREFSIKDFNNISCRQVLFATDNSIFQIFDFSLEEGNQETALVRPKSVVLSRENALKYLGSEDVIGKSLSLEWEGKEVDFEITGILADIPGKSHLQFDMLISISSYPDEQFSNWRSNYLYTYILAGENIKKKSLEEKLRRFVSKRLEPYYGDLLSQGLGIHSVLKIHLFPLSEIHLYPSPNWEIGSSGDMALIYIFASIAFLILTIASINFINLSTASANIRAKEVSLRKTLGAEATQLKIQFIQEFVFLAIIALILAIVLVSLFIPAFNTMFDEQLSSSQLLKFKNIIILFIETIIVGIISALYPAFYLTRFSPISALKGGLFSGTGRSRFRRFMVVIQFIISITLIIGTFTVYKQMSYIQSKSLGFDKENVILIPVPSQRTADNFQIFRDEIYHSPSIESITVSSDLPGEIFYSNTNFQTNERPGDPVSIIVIATDYDFVRTYRMQMVAGRAFSREYATDTVGTIILNEAAIQRFGWTAQESLGKELTFSGDRSGKIVGVVEDFNFRSLHSTIEPMAMILNPEYISAISVRTRPAHIKQTINFIKQKWETTFPGELFEFSFLDSRINQLYSNEIRMQHIFILFSCFSIFVACLGLFGLSVFIATDRTKEIGIRKVLGASISKIVLLLSKEFITWILLANLVAWPLAWFFMNKWLENFAYRVTLGIWIFIVPALLALIIALITLSFQVLYSAMANPVKSLRYE